MNCARCGNPTSDKLFGSLLDIIEYNSNSIALCEECLLSLSKLFLRWNANVQILIIEGTFPSLNLAIQKSKRHWSEYYALKKSWTDAIALLAKVTLTPVMNYPVDLEFFHYRKDRRSDKDNLASITQKFALDGLKGAGIIKDDSWEYIGDLTHRFDIDKVHPRVEIALIESSENSVLKEQRVA